MLSVACSLAILAEDFGKRRYEVFIFSIRGTRPDLPHIHVTQSTLICKSKQAFFLCILYQSAVVCTLSQRYFGYLLIKASYVATSKKETLVFVGFCCCFFFLQLDISFRESKLLKK